MKRKFKILCILFSILFLSCTQSKQKRQFRQCEWRNVIFYVPIKISCSDIRVQIEDDNGVWIDDE